MYLFPELVGGPADRKEIALDHRQHFYRVPVMRAVPFVEEGGTYPSLQDYKEYPYRRRLFRVGGADICFVAFVDADLPDEVGHTMVFERLLERAAVPEVDEEPV